MRRNTSNIRKEGLEIVWGARPGFGHQPIKGEEIAVSKTSNPPAGFMLERGGRREEGKEESCRHCGRGLVIELVLLVPDCLPSLGESRFY